MWGKKTTTTSAFPLGFGERAQLLGVDVSQLLQLPLTPAVQVLYVHDVALPDPGLLPELVPDAGQEARLALPGPQELAVQRQHLLLELTVACHRVGGGGQVTKGGRTA